MGGPEFKFHASLTDTVSQTARHRFNTTATHVDKLQKWGPRSATGDTLLRTKTSSMSRLTAKEVLSLFTR